MTFGRWLLIHSFAIFLVCLLIIGYVYREELQLQQAYEQLLNIEAKPIAQSSKPPADQKKQAAEIKIIQKPRTEVASESAHSSTDNKANRILESKPTISEVIIEQDELLFRARQAYWDKDYKTAIQGYQQLIKKDQDNADYLGELGNIYYALNDFPNASMHYYQAALVLINNNHRQQASLLVSPVTAMNRELGDKLKQRLMQ